MKNQELLKQIDDAASQLGGTMNGNQKNSRLNSRNRSPTKNRKINSEMHLDSVPTTNVPRFKNQLRGEDLMKIPSGSRQERFDVTKTVVRDYKYPPANDYVED